MAEAKTATARGYDWPDEGELVVCTVSNVKNFGAFVTLDEYESKEGFIHIAEVSSGWIKYIRDYVREGQKVVCKVLKVDKEKGHIDLSLKAVNEHQRREKIQEWKNEQKAENLLGSWPSVSARRSTSAGRISGTTSSIRSAPCTARSRRA